MVARANIIHNITHINRFMCIIHISVLYYFGCDHKTITLLIFISLSLSLVSFRNNYLVSILSVRLSSLNSSNVRCMSVIFSVFCCCCSSVLHLSSYSLIFSLFQFRYSFFPSSPVQFVV